MAIMTPANVLPFPQPQRPVLPPPLAVELPAAQPGITREGNALKIELDDGGVLVDLNPVLGRPKSDKFDANLADDLDEMRLAQISSELLLGIEHDDQSRQEWLSTYAEGIKLLGLTIEDNSNSGVGQSSAPLEGMSTVRHPLLAEACLLFQANARGELLPAAGPVKVRDDQTEKPATAAAPMAAAPGMGHNGGPPLGDAPMPPSSPMGSAAPPPPDRAVLANALETDFNHYLTVTAPEYVPDTDQMLFKVAFGGLGIKKVYNCPLRRRPVSESINIEDFIVSNALTDLGNAARITHRSRMKPSTLKRLQILGVYRDVVIGTPTQSDQPNAVDQAKAEMIGVQPQVQDPKDADHIIYECYCELIIDEFAPAHFRGKSLALPYRVTIEKDSQKVLEIRRNWREDDEQCMAREFFVEFPYVKTFGFYGTGLLHILGNTTKALTAVWREFIDKGAFANFPGFLYAKGAGRQLTNQFRVPPGGGVGIDIGLQNIKDAVMPLPYSDLGPSFEAFVRHVEETGQRLGGTAQIAVGEGRQDAPVGTTIALIEQATKPVGAVLKRLHDAQAKEFKLLKERFRDDPEAFWRFNKKPAQSWQKEQFIAALDDFDLVPVSDPNNPTRLHRTAKALALQQMAVQAPSLFDLRKVVERVGAELDIDDVEGLLAPPQPPQAPPVDPHKMADLQLKGQKLQMDAQTKTADAQLDLAKAQLEMRDREAERANKLQVAQIEQDTERLRLASTLAIHADKAEAAQRALHMKIGADAQSQARDHLHQIMSAPRGERGNGQEPS